MDVGLEKHVNEVRFLNGKRQARISVNKGALTLRGTDESVRNDYDKGRWKRISFLFGAR